MSIQIGDVIRFKYDDLVIEKRLADDVWEDITPLSAVGQALLGKEIGDRFKVYIPATASNNNKMVDIEILGVN